MAIQKDPTVNLIDEQSIAAGSSASSGWRDISRVELETIVGKITNGATAPTVRPVFTVEVASSGAGTDATEVYRALGGVTNDAVYPFRHHVDVTARFYRVTIDNTGESTQAITGRAWANRVGAR